jgi:hypothetical protein
VAPAGAKKGEDKGVGEIASDLWQLLRDYAKQEIVDPLAALKRFMTFGLGGAILLALGLFFLSLAVLRGLQTETGTALTGVLDWVPYAATLAVDVLACVVTVVVIKKPLKSEESPA